MVAQLGRSVLLKVESSPGSGTYNTIGGLRTTSVTINNEIVDITNKDSAGVRELLESAGVKSFSLSGAGVFTDASAYQVMRAAAIANTHLNYQLVLPGSSNPDTYQGAFAITQLEQAGEYNGEMTYSVTLESAGTVTVVA